MTAALIVPSGCGTICRGRPCGGSSRSDTLVVRSDDARGANITGCDCRGERAAIVDSFVDGDPRGIHAGNDDVLVIVFLAAAGRGSRRRLLGF